MKDNVIMIRVEPEIRVIDKVYKKKKSYKCCGIHCPFASASFVCKLFNVHNELMAFDKDRLCLRCNECLEAEEENEG